MPHDRTHLELPVRLPTSMPDVSHLLNSMAEALETASRGYRGKQGHPRYQDLTETARAIRALAVSVVLDSKKRWDEFNGQRPLPFDGDPPGP